MDLRLGINCGFAINRYIEPEVWTKIVQEDLGLRYVQFVADLLNPYWEEKYVRPQVDRIRNACEKHNIVVESVFTSAYTRVNHLLHPDKEARAMWVNWFKNFFSIAAELGATNGGSHFGIMTFDTYDDPKKREAAVAEAVRCWQELTFHAQEVGFDSVIFEPMSVGREMGDTIEQSQELLDRVNAHCGVPMKICLDVGHAPHPTQRDPYPWIRALGAVSPIVHLQQTVLNSSSHWPFTPECNAKGIISGERVLEELEKSGCQNTLLAFEISHREHADTDHKVIGDLAASVEYWRQFVPTDKGGK